MPTFYIIYAHIHTSITSDHSHLLQTPIFHRLDLRWEVTHHLGVQLHQIVYPLPMVDTQISQRLIIDLLGHHLLADTLLHLAAGVQQPQISVLAAEFHVVISIQRGQQLLDSAQLGCDFMQFLDESIYESQFLLDWERINHKGVFFDAPFDALDCIPWDVHLRMLSLCSLVVI